MHVEKNGVEQVSVAVEVLVEEANLIRLRRAGRAEKPLPCSDIWSQPLPRNTKDSVNPGYVNACLLHRRSRAASSRYTPHRTAPRIINKAAIAPGRTDRQVKPSAHPTTSAGARIRSAGTTGRL